MNKILLTLLAVICLQVYAFAQSGTGAPRSMSDITAKLQSWQSSRVVEKAYLQFDKPFYEPGDTLFFKAYVTMGERNELSKISGVLHVDLIGGNDSLMRSVILQLKNGLAWGELPLPANLGGGNVRLRAYTQWMRNSGDKYIFEKPVMFAGVSATQVPARTGKVDLQFFPEGGTFVNSVPSRIAFKAIGTDGLGVAVKGSIIDDKNVEVTKFVTAHLGMGEFYLTPEAGKTYRAKVSYPDNSTAILDLPKAQETGMTLAVNDKGGEKLSIDINANKAYYLANKNKEINIVMFSGGIIKSVKTVLDNQVIGFDLPKKDLKTGVLQITVFSDNGTPVNERLVFVQNNNNLINLLATTDKPVYASQTDVKISLNAKTADQPDVAYLSAAVVDAKVMGAADNAGNILSYLLLSSDVKGYVEQPGYYFNNPTADTRSQLDILMRTQGYRRFIWNDLLNEDKPVTSFQPEAGINISGYLKSKDGRPLPNEKVTLLLASSGQTLTQPTDANGRFAFENLAFNDKTKFMIQLDASAVKAGGQVTLEKSSNTLPVSSTYAPADRFNNEIIITSYTPAPEMVQADKHLKQVNINAKRSYRSTSLAGSGNADQVFFHDDIKNAVSLSQALAGRARGIRFSNGNAYQLNGLVIGQAGSGLSPMMLIVDGSKSSTNLDNINPSDVETVEILKGANTAAYGIDGAKGVIVINTRQGGEQDEDQTVVMSPGFISIIPQGFNQGRQFYTPAYSVTGEARRHPATTYWASDIVTDKDGNATLTFKAGSAGDKVLVVEGLDSAGNIARSVIKYKVQ